MIAFVNGIHILRHMRKINATMYCGVHKLEFARYDGIEAHLNECPVCMGEQIQTLLKLNQELHEQNTALITSIKIVKEYKLRKTK